MTFSEGISSSCQEGCSGYVVAPHHPGECGALVCLCPCLDCPVAAPFASYPHSPPYKVQCSWVPITKLKSHSRTAYMKLHPGDPNWNCVCSQTLQALISRRLWAYSHRWQTLFPSHSCPHCIAIIQRKNKILSVSLQHVDSISLSLPLPLFLSPPSNPPPLGSPNPWKCKNKEESPVKADTSQNVWRWTKSDSGFS